MIRTPLVVIVFCLSTSTGLLADQSKAIRRVLNVALYPYIPEKAELYWRLEQEFEGKYPEIDLRYVETGDTYYKSNPAKVLSGKKADVAEVDTIMLLDLIDQMLIEEIPASSVAAGEFLPVADGAVRLNNKIYGVPHWVCGNFLYYRKDDPEFERFQAVKSLTDLEKIIGRPLSDQQSLLTDLRGKSTLGEKYLDALLDKYGTPEQVYQQLNNNTPNPEAIQALNRLFDMCPGGLCDSSKHHDYSPFYAHQFSERKARAFIGYSERMFFVIDHFLNGVREDQPAVGQYSWDNNGDPVGVDEIDAIPATLSDDLSDKGPMTLTWVDALCIRSGLDEQTKKDAMTIIDFYNSSDFTLRALVPDYGHAPRYLLPARKDLFQNAKLLRAAPLYGRFYEAMQNGVTLSSPGLNDKVRKVGETIENDGFNPRQ